MVKKIILLNLVCWMGILGVAEAQTIRHFQFQFKNGHYLTAKEGVLTASEPLSGPLSGESAALQWFEVTMQDDFSFRLAPLSDTDRYLTSKSGSLKLKGSSTDATNWKVVYAGAGYVSITGADGQLILADVEGTARLISVPGKLRSTHDEAGDHYRLKVISGEPEVHNEASGVLEAEGAGVEEQALQVQSYPNPLTDYTKVVYRLLEEASVNISILDLQGRVVHVLVDDHLKSGTYETIWNRGSSKGVSVPEGLYILAAQIGGEKQKQMLVVK